jgi:hypothetical protein
MGEKEFDARMKQAKERVKRMDQSDGFKDRYSGTIYQALLCGLQNPTTGAQFDALVMLEDLYHQQRDQPEMGFVVKPRGNG